MFMRFVGKTAILKTSAIAVFLAAVGFGVFALPRASVAGGGGDPPADPAIAFHGTIKNKSGLAVCNADGTNATVIYQGGIHVRNWSPDGASIAFENGIGEIWRVDVRVVNGVPQGSNAFRLLGGDGYRYWRPAWSPQGDVILAQRGSSWGRDFVTIPAAGGTPTFFYAAPGGDGAGVGYPAWSPDGSRLAFTEQLAGSQNVNIMVLDVATGVATMVLDVSQNGLVPQHLDWARTHDALAFSDYTTGALYTLDLAEGVPVLVASEGYSPSWSPDDSELVFVGSRNYIKRINLATHMVTTLGPKGSFTNWRRH